jgi:ribosomal protein S18 acetylase RimI-like enzyme
MMVTIRKAQKDDVNQVFAVLLRMIASEDASAKKTSKCLLGLRRRRKDFVASAKRELLREFREKNAGYLVAVQDGKIVGYARGSVVLEKSPFFKPVRIGYLNALAVLKSHAGKGIASALNMEMERWLKKKGCSQIHLDVFERNPAVRIYEKWGYKTYNLKMVKRVS